MVGVVEEGFDGTRWGCVCDQIGDGFFQCGIGGGGFVWFAVEFDETGDEVDIGSRCGLCSGTGDAEEGQGADEDEGEQFHEGWCGMEVGDGLDAVAQGGAALEEADEAEAQGSGCESALDFQQGVAVVAAVLG